MKAEKKTRKRVVLYLFRRPVERELNKTVAGKYPHDFFYAFTKIDNSITVHVTDKVFKYKLLQLLDHLVIRLLYSKIKTGTAFFSVLFLIPQIRKADLVFCTVDSYALPYALLKLSKIITTPFIFNTIGLCDALNEAKSDLFKKIVVKILKSCDRIISGASYFECKKLASVTGLHISKFSFIPFGIDTVYFQPKKVSVKSEFILIVGADPKRDWILYLKIISHLPNIKFVIITNKKAFETIPQNVEIYYNLPIEEVRDWIWKSTLILILSKQNYHFAGQSTILRGMSCSKTVIFTASYGTKKYGFKNFKNSVLVPPGGYKEVINAINALYNNRQKLFSIGEQARKLVVKDYNVNSYSQKISATFKRVLEKYE